MENSYWSEITLSELVVKIPSAMKATIEEAVCDWRKITESILLFGPSRHAIHCKDEEGSPGDSYYDRHNNANATIQPESFNWKSAL